MAEQFPALSDEPLPSLTDSNVPVVAMTGGVSRRKAMLVNLFFQYGALVLTLIHGLLMVPLYLRYIDTVLYGAWLASGNVIYWAAVAQGGTTYLLAQRAAHYYGKRELNALGEIVGSGLFLLAVLSTAAAVIAGVLTPFIPTWFHLEGTQAVQLQWAFVAAIATLWLRLMCLGFIAIEQGYQRPFGVGIINVVTGIIHLFVTVWFLLLGWGVLAIPLGTLVREVLCASGLAIHLVHTNHQMGVKLRITRQSIKSLTSLSVWTFFTFLNEVLDNGTVLLLIGLVLGSRNVTVVTVSSAAWAILIVILQRFVASVQPGLAHLEGEGNHASVIRVSNQMMLAAFGAFAVAMGVILALNSPFVSLWGKPRLYAGEGFNISYAAAALFFVITFGVSQTVLSLGAIRASSIVQTVVNTARILAMAALLLPLGVLSVPLGAMAALMVFGLLLLRLWQSVVLQSSIIPWNGLWRGMRLLVVARVIGWAGHALLHPTTWLGLVSSAVTMTLVMSILVVAIERSLFETVHQVLHSMRVRQRN